MDIKQLKQEVENSPEARKKLLDNPEQFINDLPDPRNDKQVFLVVLYVVSGVLIGSLIFMGILVVLSEDKTGTNVPQFLVTLASTALGALVGLLVPNSGS